MSNPWDLGSSSRSGDADMQGVGSSSSLLQSIYGSQASQLLSAMSSQLVIEEESEDDDGWGDDAVVRHSSGVPRSSRPKSSPASAIAARQKLQRPQTASAVSLSSTGRRQHTEKAETSNIISAVMTSCSTRHLSRPSSARPQLQSASTGNPRSHRRPASASAHNSSYSSLASSSSYRPPIQHAVQKKPSRPKSAFVTSSRSVPNISYKAMEEEPLANSRPSLKTSMSVLRTSEPEYLNFWEGKPLSERGGMVFHERKQWKRPKSDYGPRHYTRTNSAGSRKSSTSALTKVVEAWGEGEDDQDKRKDTHDGDHGVTTGQGDLLKDLLSGMGDSNGDDEKNKKSKDDDDDDRYRKRDTSENKRDRDAYRSAAHSDSRYGKAIEEEDEGIDDDYFQKNEDDDKLPEIPSSTSITSSLSGTDLLNVTSGIEMDISPKCQLKLPPTIDAKEEDNPDLLPRIVSVTPPDKPTPTVPGRLKDFVQYCSYFSDDESDKEINMDWLKSRLAITKHCTRFELPLDLTKLEGLAPVDYLQTYCIIAERRAVFYSKIFKKFLKYQKEALSREDLLPALLEAQFNMENADQMKAVLKVVDIPAGMTAVPLKLFAGIAALAERMLRYSPL